MSYSEGKTVTITFCDVGENHVGMEQIGNLAESGYSLDTLRMIRDFFTRRGYSVERHLLIDYLPEEYAIIRKNIPKEDRLEKPRVLVIRNGLAELGDVNSLCEEMMALPWDTKAKMYGRVVNKKARFNLCFADYSAEPNYQEGKGRVIDFRQVPFLRQVRRKLQKIIGDEETLIAEGNYYYSNKCGIGYHGDAERKKVVGVRLGASIPLTFQWYYRSKRIGEKHTIQLNHGDIYFMSAKATGNDFKKKIIPTLRHAAGSSKYTN